VRILPDELHINDPDYYDTIYAPASRPRDKYAYWVRTGGVPTSAFATVRHDHHRLRRAVLNPFFSKQSVTRLEPMITSKVQKLCERFRAAADTGEVIRLDVAFMAVTMDIIMQYAYAWNYNYLDKPNFALEWRNQFTGALRSTTLTRQIPWMFPVMNALPPGLVKAMMPQMALMIDHRRNVTKQAESVLSGQAKDDGNATTIFHALLKDEHLPPAEKSFNRLKDEGEVLISAGTETTAKTLTTIAFYLLEQPDTLRRLKEELRQAMPDAWDSPPWVQLEPLPFLTAVIQEGLRLSYGVTNRLPRIATKEVLMYGNWKIPVGVR
jgi:cytochrome P450